jgi:hypothetical protein
MAAWLVDGKEKYRVALSEEKKDFLMVAMKANELVDEKDLQTVDLKDEKNVEQ